MDLTKVAGGILWRETSRGHQLAVVHRRRQRDWSIPKGRVDPGEPWRRAALREVAEETGCAAALLGFAGAKLVVNRSPPRVVLYWHMRVVERDALDVDDEIDDIAWLSWRDALSRLDHPSDRLLLLRAGAGPGSGPGRGSALTSGRLRRLVVVDGVDEGPWLPATLGIVARAAGLPAQAAASR